jgi:sterol desaturase/sphingolipid hydroxylase (fatty acid hydroxylase superfamily)
MSKVIVFATPVFILLIALEFIWSRTRASRTAGQTPYRLSDTINSISLGMLSQLVGVLSKLFTIGIYTVVFGAVALFPATEFWNTWYGVLLALVMYDFCYYWLHRAGHVVALFWAAHVVHHQSQHYNLSTALRQTSSGFLFGWIFYLPMAVLGVPPTVFGIVLLIDLLYQFWVHTEQVGKLGWFDRVFCSPSNHRVHHAVNDPYIDKNYGGILILWDRLFGTFQKNTNPVSTAHAARSTAGTRCGPTWRCTGAGQGILAHPELGRQAGTVVQATRLAKCGHGAGASQTGLHTGIGHTLQPAPAHRPAMVCRPAVCAGPGRGTGLFVERRRHDCR